MLDAIKDFIDSLLGPTTFFLIAITGLFVMIRFRALWTKGWFAGSLLVLVVVGFVLSTTDADFVAIVGKPDNVPILIMMGALSFLMWLSLRKMVINDELTDKGLPTFEAREANRRVHCWPDLVYGEFLVLILCSVLLLVWAYYLKAPLEEPASSARTPNPSKAPWYFLGLQEMLVYYDPWLAGVVFPTQIVVGLMAIPYIDPNRKGSGYFTFKERPFAISTFLFGFISLWAMLIILGTFLRGPNWNFFGPYEYWDAHKPAALVNVQLHELFWISLLKSSVPEHFLIRELPGIVLLGLYFFGLPWIFMKSLFRRLYARLGGARYAVLMVLLLWMALVPSKMAFRWTINGKYFLTIPEWFFNI